MNDMGEIITEFLAESYDSLDQLDRDLVMLEENPSSTETIASIFRTIHTIKGTCGFLGFSKLEGITHVGENLLSKLRDGILKVTEDTTSSLLSMVDAIREIFAHIEVSSVEGDRDYSDLIKWLTRLQSEEAVKAAAANLPFDSNAGTVAEPEPAIASAEVATVVEEPAPVAAEPVPAPVVVEPEPVVAAPTPVAGTPAPAPVAATPAPAPAAAAPAPKPAAAAAPTPTPKAKKSADNKASAPPPKRRVSENSIRVGVGLLDHIMNLVGELVLARNQILQFGSSQENVALVAATQRLNLITTELQEGVMKTRMQPIGNGWSVFPRVVRDLSITCGKQVRFTMEGRETELDKTLLEAIKDPLTHIIRNAVDHGIETPDVREATGKSREGSLSMCAYHEGGQVNIDIVDDGGGIDPEVIGAKAIERGLVTAEQLAKMGEREVLNMVFLPGFSTAAKVTNVSGRGVGMDVVKTNIEKIGGSIVINSVVQGGTTINIKLPLTLAIIPALILTSANARYAIPQVSLLEVVRLDEKNNQSIEMIHETPVYRLRGNLLPLVYLHKVLGYDSPSGDKPIEPGEEEDHSVNIIVLQADSQTFGLVVEGIHDTEEIVVKPLSKQLKGIGCYAGATIMGDGRVALILDVVGIAKATGVVSEGRDKSMAEAATEAKQGGEERCTLLVFRTSDDGRMAIPLDKITRLEEFSRDDVELAGGLEVVQYRDDILPLVSLSDLVPERRSAARYEFDEHEGKEENRIQVVVYSKEGRTVGLVVEQILDTVEATMSFRSSGGRAGILGSLVIGGRVTEIFDVDSVLESVDLSFFEQEDDQQLGA